MINYSNLLDFSEPLTRSFIFFHTRYDVSNDLFFVRKTRIYQKKKLNKRCSK